LDPVTDRTARGPNTLDGRLAELQNHPRLGVAIRLYLSRREQVLFLVVGFWNTVFAYSFWALLQYLLGDRLPYVVVLLLAWPVVVLNAYLGYRYVVFRSTGRIRTELPRFSLIYLATLIANIVLLPIALAILPYNIYIVEALFTAAVVVASYFGHRYFSFRRPRL
jgi:putative flippase GtrA